MKKSWLPWILLVAVFGSAQFWGSNPFINRSIKYGNGVVLYNPAGTGQAVVGSGFFELPACPTDPTSVPAGALCFNTASGNTCSRDAGGFFNIRGGGVC